MIIPNLRGRSSKKKSLKEKSSKALSIAIVACASGLTGSRNNKTPLFQAIVQCGWIDIQHFIVYGSWNTIDDYYGDSTMTPEQQARHWTNYYDSYSDQKLRQLPLHAAITHLAPLSVIQLIVQLYPRAVKIKDNQGNLPLHIAFMTNAQDVSSFLLKVFPDGLMEVNDNGNLPLDCYDHLYRSVLCDQEEEDPDHLLQPTPTPLEIILSHDLSCDEREVQNLEDLVAKDEQRIAAAERQFENLQTELQEMTSHNVRMQRSLMAASVEEEECSTMGSHNVSMKSSLMAASAAEEERRLGEQRKLGEQPAGGGSAESPEKPDSSQDLGVTQVQVWAMPRVVKDIGKKLFLIDE